MRLSRADVLRKGVRVAGAVCGVELAGPAVRQALASSNADVAILSYLLKFELLEVGLFQGGLRRLKASGEMRLMMEELEVDERRHIEVLTEKVKDLGGKPTKSLRYGFAYRPSYVSVFLRLAAELEERVIAAYNGAIPMLSAEQAVGLTGSIVEIEGRHAAKVLSVAGKSPSPRAFDPAHSEYDALKSIERFVGPTIYQ